MLENSMIDLITIIVPVYNVEKYISRCIDSILKQSYDNFELILINDESKDSSLEVCQKYAKKDNRIIVINKKNGGASSARNAGLDIMRGKYVTFIDSDDYICKDYINNLYKSAIKGNYDIVQCDFNTVSKCNAEVLDVVFNNQDIVEIDKISALNKRKYKVCIWGKIYRASLFDNFRFREKIIYEDDDSYYYLVDKARRIALLNESLYYYYMSDNSVMRNNSQYKRTDFIDVYERRIDYFIKKRNKVLLHGSYERFCIVLMLFYSKCICEKNNRNDLDEIIALFEANYEHLNLSKVTYKRDALLLFSFHISHNVTGRLLKLFIRN